MRILIVAATKEEIEPFLKIKNKSTFSHVDVLITGVGVVATSFALTKTLVKDPVDLIVNVGIAGTFHENIPLGTLVRIHEDSLSELGAEDNHQFISLKELGFGEVSFKEDLKEFILPNSVEKLTLAQAITVNTTHGNKESILAVKQYFSPDTESMEGAAVFYVAEQLNIARIQIRSISNLIEIRNKDNWNIPLAIANLNHWLIQFITEIQKKNI